MRTLFLVVSLCAVIFIGNQSVGAESQNPFGFETQKNPVQYDYCKKDFGALKKGHGYYVCVSGPDLTLSFTSII